MNKAKTIIISLFFVSLFCLSVFSAADYGQIRFANTEEKKIALTFDDGPHPTKTYEVLDILAENKVKGTFFMVGENIKMYPDVAKRVCDDGHEIGNHTETHVYASKSKSSIIKNQIVDTHMDIFDILGVNTKLIRPPGGGISREFYDTSRKMGYKIILWNIDTRDWAHTKTKEITNNVKNNISPGSIILFHDYISGESHTCDALKEIIPYLKTEGYTFCTVSELLK